MKSNKLSLVIVAGALLAGMNTGAFADDKYNGELGSNWQDHVKSTKSRAQVLAELEQARAQGLLSVGEDPHYPRQATATSSRSRAEVQAEAAQNPMLRASKPDDLYFGG